MGPLNIKITFIHFFYCVNLIFVRNISTVLQDSPHTEGFVAQVIPALAHVVQSPMKESPVFRVPQ